MRRTHFGLTLTELIVTIAIAAVLMAIAVPAAQRITRSLRDSAGARALIGAALSNARAIAIRNGKDAGVRFQRAADGNTYMIFIIYDYDASVGVADRFVAVEGRKPIQLPENMGVIDGFYVQRSHSLDTDINLEDSFLLGDLGYGRHTYFEDTSTFSIVFSPSGKIITRLVQVRRRGTNDPTFNVIENGVQRGMFVQDMHPTLLPGIGPENSRRKFTIYDKTDLSGVNPTQRWTDYFGRLNPLMVSPYTGELIGE